MAKDTLLELKIVKKYFPIYAGGVIKRHYKMCKAVDDVSFTLARGDCFGIAGESGSGKTTVARLILKLESLTSGTITFDGKDVDQMKGKELLWYRSRLQTVFQDAGSSLSPRMSIKDIVAEPLEVHNDNGLTKQDIADRTEKVLSKVGLGAQYLRRYPHELSGGQKQRVGIARAIVLEPSLVILDEPVSSLDVSVRAQILNLMADIQDEHHLTYIIIAHDLAMMQQVTSHIAVMYLGKIVEIGDTKSVFSSPQHPYTKALLAAIPRPEPGRAKMVSALSGEIGNPIDPPPGCRFHPRCPLVMETCREKDPILCEVSPGHQVACYLSGLISGVVS
jgi:oligopeptide transport system ATP-binding protein